MSFLLMSSPMTSSPTSSPMMSTPKTSLAAVAGQPPSLAAVAGQPQYLTTVAGQPPSLAAEPGECMSAAIFFVGGIISGGSAAGATSVLNDSNKCHSSYSSHILAVPSRDSANDARTDDATTGNTSSMTHDEIIAPKLPHLATSEVTG
jgi:hypothetical protein